MRSAPNIMTKLENNSTEKDIPGETENFGYKLLKSQLKLVNNEVDLLAQINRNSRGKIRVGDSATMSSGIQYLPISALFHSISFILRLASLWEQNDCKISSLHLT